MVLFVHTWGVSEVGIALRSHRRGQGFESPTLHHRNVKSLVESRLLFIFQHFNRLALVI